MDVGSQQPHFLCQFMSSLYDFKLLIDHLQTYASKTVKKFSAKTELLFNL